MRRVTALAVPARKMSWLTSKIAKK